MNGRTFLLAILAFGGVHGIAALGANAPNIVLVVVDDLPPDMCNFASRADAKNLTPNIDRLAAEGVVLTNFHSPSPICTPSRFAILSGLYPSRCRDAEFTRTTKRYGQSFVSFNTFLTPEDAPLAARFKKLGYRTGAVGKNHVIGTPGFQHLPYLSNFDDPQVRHALVENERRMKAAYHAAGFDYAERLYYGNTDADGIEKLAVHNHDWIMEGAVEFLREADQRPFFLYLGTTVPHGPFEAERSWRGDRRVTPTGFLDAPVQLLPSADSIAQRLQERNDDRFNRGSLLWLDDSLGLLMAELEKQQVAESTLIIFTSDHGTQAKGSVYQAGTLTSAFFWRKGGLPAGHSLESPLMLTDLAPTLLELAGGLSPEAATEFDGASFAPQLLGKPAPKDRTLYFEVGYSRGVSDGRYKYIAVRFPPEIAEMPLAERKRRLLENNEKLKQRGRPIATTDPQAPFSHLSPLPGGNDAERVSIDRYPAYFEPDQLYDLRRDPREQRNLAANPRHAATLQRMRRLLATAMKDLPGSFPLHEPAATATAGAP